jgi:hypothetical protein
MRAGLRIATTAAAWAIVFVAAAQLHIVGEKSIATTLGALLWLTACAALALARPRAQARRFIVLTGTVATGMLVASVAIFVVDNTLWPEVLTAIAFLATLQCFAAALCEIGHDLGEPVLERSWITTGRLLVVVDVATVLIAIAWGTNVVERRSRGRFRVTQVSLTPVGNAGRACLAAFVLVLAVVGAHFLVSLWRTRMVAREVVPSNGIDTDGDADDDDDT